MKKLIIISLILFIASTLTTEAKTNKIKIKATEQTKTNIHYGINNGKIYAKIGNVKIKSNKSIKCLNLVSIGF